MALTTATIRGVPSVVDSATPTVPHTMSRPGGQFIQDVATALRALSDRAISVKAFEATGDGVTDDTAAIQAALAYIEATGRSGILYFPAGTYILSSTLLIATSYTRILGDGQDRTTLKIAGSGPAIRITAFEACEVSDLRLEATDATTNGTTHGITYEYSGASTGYRHRFTNLHIINFNAPSLPWLVLHS